MNLLEGEVGDLSHDGRGVVRCDGKVYFVEGALPGERIRFTRQRRRKKHEIGALEEVLEASPERAEPPCRYFGTCGGCALQHLDPAAQIRYKQRTLLENLERLGNVCPEQVLEPLVGPQRGYRRKARLGIRFVPKKGGVLVGFRERHKSYITSLDECLAMDQRVSALLPALHELVAQLSCYQRLPQIEVACADTHIAMVFRHLEALTETDIAILKDFAEQSDVDVYLQPGGLDTVHCLAPAEPRPLEYRLDGFDVSIRFEPTDFIQVNAELNTRMVEQAIELLDLQADDQVLELFCGIGNFSLPLATQAARVMAVEANQALVDRAWANARRNDLDNLEFAVADLYTEQVAALKSQQDCNKLLLDPPRSGAIEVVRDLVPEIWPERIVYVSCNPGTLARDSELLVRKHGYQMLNAGVMDMFPHTAHVESIAVFSREN